MPRRGPARRAGAGRPGGAGVLLHLRGPREAAPPWWPPPGGASLTASDASSASASRAQPQPRTDAGLPLTRRPDAGFVGLARQWADGRGLATIVIGDGEGVTGGDFVRNIKQLIDLLRQIGDLAPDPATARAARQAADALFRGVVAASSVADRSMAVQGGGPPTRVPGCPRRLHGAAWSATPPRSGPTTRRRSSAATSPTSTARSSPWSTCPRWSRAPCSPATRGRPRASGGSSSTSSSATSTSAATTRVDATVGLARAEQLYERVFFEYGDDSVAQLGGVHLACEQASNMLTKVLEWGRLMSYMEKSTRYVAYDARLANGRYRYYRDPAILDSPLGARYVGDMDRLFDAYRDLLPVAQRLVRRAAPRSERGLRLRVAPVHPGQGLRRPPGDAAGRRHLQPRASTPAVRPTRPCCPDAGPPAPRGPRPTPS